MRKFSIKKGNLWVGGVNGGLNLFIASTNSFFNYQNEPDNAFSLSQRTVSSLFEDNQGNLWVGTHRGGVKKILPSPNGPLRSDVSAAKEIKQDYTQSTISFGFAALNYTASENNQYAYKLEGLEDSWNYAGTDHKATYTNLDPGTYTFRVKASNNNRVWNERGTSVKIIITPPFWKTWWFRSFMLFTFFGGIGAYLWFRREQEMKKLEEKKREEMHQMQL